MEQQTAIQKLIEDIRNDNDICFLNDGHIEYYLAMEKEQIMKAYDDGAINTMQEQEGLDISMDQNGEEAERYYNENYNK